MIDNVVIKVLTPAHGEKVIQYFNSLGVDTLGFAGNVNERDGCSLIYYGMFNGRFGHFNKGVLEDTGVQLIELPKTNNYPKKMLIGNNIDDDYCERVVVGEILGKYCFISADESEKFDQTGIIPNNLSGIYLCKFAKDIEIIELTVSEIENKLNIPKGTLRIKSE